MGKFALGFLAGIVWFWKGPGSLPLAEALYDYELRKEERERLRRIDERERLASTRP